MIEQTYLKQWKEFNEAALAMYRESSEAQKAALRDLSDSQFNVAGWGGMAQVSLDSLKAITDINQNAVSGALHAQLDKLDLSDAASSLREVFQIYTSTVTGLVQNQMNLLSLVVEDLAKYLEAVKQAQGWEEILAAPAHLLTDLQEQQKTSMLDAAQKLAAIQPALTAWIERAINNAAASETPAPKPKRALPRAASVSP